MFAEAPPSIFPGMKTTVRRSDAVMTGRDGPL